MKILLLILCFGTVFSAARILFPESNLESECSYDEFRCNDGDCIPKEARCDGKVNCAQGEDEIDCECHNRFKCSNGRCIDFDQFCDGVYDCDEGEDEVAAECNSIFRIETSTAGNSLDNTAPIFEKSTTEHSYFKYDLVDREDENSSKNVCNGMFACGDGFCIASQWQCDGETDCLNGSDEVNCTLDEQISKFSSPNEFDPKVEEVIAFIPIEATFVPPTVDLVLDIHNIELGKSYNLTCEITGNPTPNVTFKKLGADSFGSNVQPVGNTLRFFDVNFENRGIYQCIAEANGVIVKANTIVNVEALEELKVEIYPPGPQVVQQAGYVLLECRIVAGNPGATIEWFRRDQGSLSDDMVKIADGRILIWDTASEYGTTAVGEFVCRATAGSLSTEEVSSIFIQPIITPQITIYPDVQEITLVEGEQLDLFCAANESASVTWHTLNTTTPDYSLITYRSATLRKFAVNRNDEGIYICRADNKGGYNEKQIKVLVEPKVDVIDLCETFKPCKNNGICVNYGSNFTCDCPLHFTGEICQYNTPIKFASRFRGNGYIELNRSIFALEPDDRHFIEFVLSTSEPNGLLFWWGQKTGEAYDGQDFIALAAVDGFLKCTVRMAGRETEMLGQRIDDGERHVVIFAQSGENIRIQVDNFQVTKTMMRSIEDNYNWPGNIFIGGTPNMQEFTGNRFTHGFNGDIYIINAFDDTPIDIYNDAVGGFNVASYDYYD